MNNPSGWDDKTFYDRAVIDVEKMAVENILVRATNKVIAGWANAGLRDEASQQIYVSGVADPTGTVPDGVGARAFDLADVGVHDQTG